jgi:formate-dependent phosphoribosylglycinamide formyltransferase (GAR transformylase)
MEKLASVDVFETSKDLKKNALHTRRVEGLVIPRLHQLVQVTVHVLHGNVKPSAVGVQEDVESRYQVRMRR